MAGGSRERALERGVRMSPGRVGLGPRGLAAGSRWCRPSPQPRISLVGPGLEWQSLKDETSNCQTRLLQKMLIMCFPQIRQDQTIVQGLSWKE